MSQPLPPDPAGALPLLQDRSFRMLSFTRFSSRVAQNALNFGLVLLIVEETQKAFLSSLLVLALVVPSTVAGIAAGAAADALPKRFLIVAGDVVRAVACIVFALRGEGVEAYYLIAVILAAASQFATSAEGAIQPAIVGRARLARANAISQAVGGVAQIVGFGVLTPVVLRVFGQPEILFYVAGALFAVAAVQAVLIGRVEGTARGEVGGEATDPWYSAGFRHIRRNPQVLRAAIELTLISTSLIILAGLIPAFLGDVLGLPVDIGVLILMPAALGVALGLRTAGFLAHRIPHAALSSAGFVGFVVLLGLLAFVNQLAEFMSGYGVLSWLDRIQIGNFDAGGVMAMVIVAPLGFAYALVAVAGQTVINDLVPLHMQGRVQSAQAAAAAVCASLPVLAAGALSDLVGVVPVMALLAGLTGAAAIATRREVSWLAMRPEEPSRARR